MVATRSYIPEIHDISPRSFHLLESLLSVLPDSARDKAALMVIPNWGGRFPIDMDPVFSARLRETPGEKVLHGCTHLLGANRWNRFWFGSDNHAEFARLSMTEALYRLQNAWGLFVRCLGDAPRWFCAPRWKQSHGATKALERLGFQGYVTKKGYVLFDKFDIKIQAVYFDVGTLAWKRALNRLFLTFVIRKHLVMQTPFRLILHPADLQDPKTWKQIARLTTYLEKNQWKPISMGQALGL